MRLQADKKDLILELVTEMILSCQVAIENPPSYLFFLYVQKCTWKTQYSLLSRKINKMSTPGISQLSSQSSPRSQTPRGSETSTVLCSEDNAKINIASSDVMSESAQAKEQQPLFPCKLLFLTAISNGFAFSVTRENPCQRHC